MRVNLVSGWRRAAVWALSVLVRGWVRTLRFTAAPEEVAQFAGTRGPSLILIWHNRGAFSIPWLVRNLPLDRSVYAMVSASRDGATMGRFFQILGLKLIHGSSSRFGREALQDMIACLRAGHHVALTPDGPRGPVYEIKASALLAARRAQVPILLVGVEFKNAWRLRSWDRYFVPKPFSGVVIRIGAIPLEALGRGEEALAMLRQRLLELSGAVDDAPGAGAPVAAGTSSG